MYVGTDLWKAALLVNERNDVQRLLSQQVKNGLVVLELDTRPVDPLLVILLLLHLEDVPDKELLEVLVAIVYAHLLKAVLFEGFEAENVQDADGNVTLPFVLGGELKWILSNSHTGSHFSLHVYNKKARCSNKTQLQYNF